MRDAWKKSKTSRCSQSGWPAGHRQGRGRVAIRVPSDTTPGRRPAGDPDLRRDPQGAAGAGGLAALLGRDQGRDGGHR